MIGISVSGCIEDICRGKVGINDFEKIIGRTCCPDERTWRNVIAEYCCGWWNWHEFPDKAEKVLRQLLSEGRIEQPRLANYRRYPLVIDKRWLDSEEEIQWSTGWGTN